MREYRCDLHIHTCLSPCAELEMSPRRIVAEAKRRGLDAIGICDHNSAENVPAVERVAQREGLIVIGGMEITTREEVHILGLFGDEGALASVQEEVYENLKGTNDDDLFGEQVVVNEKEEVLDFSQKLLIGATELALERVVDLIHRFDGLAIAAHVDREGFGIIGQLGFIPDGVMFDALEVADPANRNAIPNEGTLPFITGSDAHTIGAVGRRWTTFRMEDLSIGEMRKSLQGVGGRAVRI